MCLCGKSCISLAKSLECLHRRQRPSEIPKPDKVTDPKQSEHTHTNNLYISAGLSKLEAAAEPERIKRGKIEQENFSYKNLRF